MGSIFREIRYAGRMLRKNPGSSTVAVIAMGLGIGLTASMFSIIDGIVLRGLPFEAPHELLHLERNNLAEGIESMEVTVHDFEDWRAQQRSFEGLAGWTAGTFNLADVHTRLPDRYNGAWISANSLDLLRERPLLGRGFEPADQEPGAAAVILLGYNVWQKRYGGDPDIVGREIRVNSEPVTVVGVMPEGFEFPVRHDAWMPLILETQDVQRGEGRTLEVWGRLRSDVGLETAANEMATIAKRLEQQYPETNEGVGTVVKPYINEYVGEPTRRMMGVMFASVCLVLVIACFNVANLLVGRASLRGRELAVRSALGSSRWQAIRHVLAEAALLSVMGAALGVVLAYVGLDVFNAALAQVEQPFWFNIYLSGRVLLFVTGISALAALLSGLVPAIQASRPNVIEVLQDASRGSTSFRLGWMSRVMVIAQVAISFALLVGAGLAVKSVVEINGYDLRFEPANVLTARMGLFEGDYPEEADWISFYERLRDRVGAMPEVASVAIATVIPTDSRIGAGGAVYEREGETYESPRQMPWARYTVVSPGYFGTLGVPLVAGRDFTVADRADAPAVAIVNEDFARKEWPDQNPLGQRIDYWQGEEEEAAKTGAGVVEVVGVVPNLRFADWDNADDQQGVYVPLAQNGVRFAWIVAKTHGDPVRFADPLRRAVLGQDPSLPLYFVRSMDQVLGEADFYPNLIGALFSTFGVIALVLACVGIYGVMAFAVTQRTQEMGVRMALGARAADILRLVLRQGLVRALVGLSLGLVLAVGIGKMLSGMLFQIEALDTTVFLLVPSMLIVLTILACLAPARRASAVDPIEALHYE